MLSRRWRALLVALLTVSSVVALVGRGGGQTGGLKITTDYELIGVDGLDGGGHITWDLSGDAARILRQKIVHMFDEYIPVVPPGFHYALTDIPANGNGKLEDAEALAYTDRLESELEGSWPTCCRHTDEPYIQIYTADILEKGFPAAQSTDGLVLTDPASTAPLEIRFKVNARSMSHDLLFQFSDIPLANALHSMFDLHQEESQGTTDPWPLVAEGGWHSVLMTDGQYALWNGNGSSYTGVETYDNNSAEAARTTTATPANNTWTWTDLRFATTANVSFRYRGSVADAGDRLRLQIAPGPTYSAWTDLQDGAGDTYLPNSPSNWTTVSYNVDAYVGQKVRLRLNFTSDATGNAAPGFFIRGFTIDGPSRYVGPIETSTAHYDVGTLDFQDFGMQSGRAHLIRTPAGDVLLYGSAYDASAPPNDFARFKGFDALENPQLLFVLLVVTAYLTSWLQDFLYDRYRKRYPERLRSKAVRIGWLRWVARVLIIFYIVFYFFPSLFVLFGASNAFVTGPLYWAFTLLGTFGVSGTTWYLYQRRAKFAPPPAEEEAAAAFEPPAPGPETEGEFVPPPPGAEAEPTRERVLSCAHCMNPISDPQAVYKCRCGQVYHLECADRIGRCPNCQRAIEGARPAEKKMVTANCPSCGEIQVVEEGLDLMQTRCEACGALMKEIERGFNYLVIAPENDLALEWFGSIVKKGVPGLALSTTFPEKLRKEFSLEGAELYWITDTDTGPKSIDPKRLDFEMMRTLSNFIRLRQGGAVLLDGFEYLAVENTFERILMFIKKVTDLASVHEITLIVPVTAGSLGADELSMLRKEFDRVIETSGKATPSATPPPPPPET